MGSNLLPFLYIFVFGVSIYFIVQTLIGNKDESGLLSWASGNEPEKSSSSLIELSRKLVHQFTLHYALRIKNIRYRKRTERIILTSGLSNTLNVDEFIGMQILWGVTFPGLLFLLNFALQFGVSPLLIAVTIPFGYWMPVLHAKAQRDRRIVGVLADMPFFIDLLSLAMEAGLDFQGAVQRIVDKTRGQSVLADELDQVLRDMALGRSRQEALRGMANRLDIAEVNSFVNVVVDADSTGTPMSKVLNDQSIQMRLERFVRAEKAGARASQMILLPMMLFILPAVFIIVMVPMALQFMHGSK